MTENALLKDDEVLSVVDELRSLGVQNYISLPQIVVVGDQSSGKSSLLEYISRVPFPKGTDMCTTFATQVIMGRDPDDVGGGGTEGEWLAAASDDPDNDGFRAEVRLEPEAPGVLYEPVRRREDVAKVITSIQNQFKEQHDGQQHVITDRILTIKLYHRSYPRLTLVDLPGYVHVRLDGQVATIVEDIHKLADRYIKEKRSIVLAVVPAVSDVANNIVLTKAKEYDPEGVRTMCIITKPDRVEKGHVDRIVRAMSGHYFKLDHGYHLIRNRTQDELNEGLDFETHTENERKLLSSDLWSQVDDGDKGIEALTMKLVKLLRSHVKNEVPKVHSELRAKLDTAQEELLKLGTKLSDADIGKKVSVMTKAITEVSRRFMDAGDGRSHGTTAAEKGESDLRATLVKYGHAFRRSLLEKAEEFQDKLEDKAITKLVAARRGRELDGFVPFQCLSAILKDCIREWEAPMDLYLTSVFKVLRKVSAALLNDVDSALVPHFKVVGETYMKELERRARAEAKEILFDDLEYPYTFSAKFLDSLQKERSNTLTNEVSANVNMGGNHNYARTAVDWINKSFFNSQTFVAKELRFALRSYLDLAIDRFVDTVSLRVVERYVFRHGKDRLRDALSSIDLKKVKEDERVTRKRTRLEKEILTLERALEKINNLQDD
ncbi:hypothetical protein HDU96_010153 [Phlyctochytrium bullatum]|nr:hypothetical protein HDU96_010153 [Phlyctochytrium bullatum]